MATFGSEGAGANPAGWIQRAIREGWSRTRALGEFRQAGGAMRTQRWYQLWSTVHAAVERRAQIAGLPPRRIPGPDQFAPWPTRTPGRFAYQANVFVRDRGTGVRMTMPSTIVYRRPVSPAKFIAEVMERATEGVEGSDDYPDLVVEGATLAGLYEMVEITEGTE